MGTMKEARDKGLEVNYHGVFCFLLRDLNIDVVDAGYEDGTFWYAKIKR